MAVTWQTDVHGTATADNLTPTKPVGTITGDLLLLHVSFEKGTDVTFGSNISQWTLVEREDQLTNVGNAVYRRAEDGAALGNITLGTSVKLAWTVTRLDGHDAATPMDVAAVGANSASGNPDPPSIDPVTDDCLIFAFCSAKTQTTYTPPSTFTERHDNPNSADGSPGQSGATLQHTGSAAVDPGTFTPGAASEWAACTVAIRPAAGGAPAEIPILVMARS